MNKALFTVAATAAAIALTWLCCMRPMLRRRDRGPGMLRRTGVGH